MKLSVKLITLLLLGASLIGCKQSASKGVTIGIIEPLEHTAMADIVSGYTQTLSQLYHQPVTIKVENAQNDANLQRAIIQKMEDAHYAVIVPIGVGTTQMTLSMVHDIPVVSLASSLTQADRGDKQSCHVAVVHDEINPRQLLMFIHTVYPHLTHLTLIHSSADKVLPEVTDTINEGKSLGMTIDHIMVSSLPDLNSAAHALPTNTQAILVLKDSLIVSGISTLAQVAAAQHIPLITSDQGSAQDGATFALGVHEREIGVVGAKLTASMLTGKPICDLPIVGMDKLTVFINQQALLQTQQALQPIMQAASQYSYQVDKVGKAS